MLKKLILMVGCLFAISIHANAQFVLTPEGLKCEDGSEYIVLTFENKTKEELFDKVHQFAGATFVSPQDVISVSGKEQITLNGVASNIP